MILFMYLFYSIIDYIKISDDKKNITNIENIKVNFFHGLVVDYASTKGHCAIIRGLIVPLLPSVIQ